MNRDSITGIKFNGEIGSPNSPPRAGEGAYKRRSIDLSLIGQVKSAEYRPRVGTEAWAPGGLNTP